MLAIAKQETDQALIYRPFLTPDYAASLSTSEFTVRLGQEIPPLLSRWTLVVQRLGQDPPTRQKQPMPLWLAQWQEWLRRFEPVHYCQGQLDRIFSHLFSNEPV
jgi:hypothetical protein